MQQNPPNQGQPQYPPQQPVPPQGWQPPQPAHARLDADTIRHYWARPKARALMIGAAAVLLVCMCGGIISIATGGSGANANQGQQTSQQQQHATNTPSGPTATPTPSYAHFGDGTFQVGKDIQPGTYRTRSGSSGCYYERLRGFSGTVDDIIANENTDGPAIVTIAAGDKGFTSQNCGTWTANLSQITKSKTSFDEGTFIVGTDIEPGTYKNTGDDGCYYARLRGFGGGFGDIIANGNPTGVAIVTIKASDKGFTSARCGTWTKQ